MQDKWAALAEKFSEREPEIKYGAGNPETPRRLELLSQAVAEYEVLDRTLSVVEKPEMREPVARLREELLHLFRQFWTDQEQRWNA